MENGLTRSITRPFDNSRPAIHPAFLAKEFPFAVNNLRAWIEFEDVFGNWASPFKSQPYT